jgi:capsular exopolysaccharide synthesis family protein
MSGDQPRYATLQDYLRVLRRRRLLIGLVAVTVFGIALGLSLSKTPVYTASAQMSFRDPLQDFNIIGTAGEAIPELPTNQLASQRAELINRPEVTRQVAKKLEAPESAGAFANAISAQVDVTTNLVFLEAVWGEPEFAAELANAYAEEAQEVAERETDKRLKAAVVAIEEQLKGARQDLPEEGAGIRVSILEQSLSSVKSLREIAETVRIDQRATPPGSPTSPNVLQDGLFGAILGLVLGLIAAFVRDSLDRRLHSAQEVHDELNMPVVGRISDKAFNHAGLARNGLAPMSETELEPFRVLRMNLGFLGEDQPLQTVLVTSSLPEEGKSTVSMALASAAVLAGQRVLLVECDLRRPSLAYRLGIKREPGLSDYLMGQAAPSDVLQVVELVQPTSVNGATTLVMQPGTAGSLVCIGAGSPVLNAPELLQTQRFAAFVEKVGKAYDLVILDGSPLLAVSDPLEVVPLVDALLVCVRAQRTTREQVRATRAALSHLPDRPAGAVITGLGRGPDSYDYYYGY